MVKSSSHASAVKNLHESPQLNVGKHYKPQNFLPDMADETQPQAAPQPEAQQAAPQPTAGGIKKRNPFLVLVFSIITLGIYGLYWIVSTTHELQRTTSSAPKAWWIILMFIPIVNIIVMFIYYWKYSKAVNELTGFSTVGLFLLWIFISPVAMILTQMQLNQKAV